MPLSMSSINNSTKICCKENILISCRCFQNYNVSSTEISDGKKVPKPTSTDRLTPTHILIFFICLVIVKLCTVRNDTQIAECQLKNPSKTRFFGDISWLALLLATSARRLSTRKSEISQKLRNFTFKQISLQLLYQLIELHALF